MHAYLLCCMHESNCNVFFNVTSRALAKEYGGQLNREQIVEVLHAAGVGEGGELAELLWTEMGLSQDAHITQVPSLNACLCFLFLPSRAFRCLLAVLPDRLQSQGSKWVTSSSLNIIERVRPPW